jgi:ABC-type phosphate/phosphonate transport system substrate-binding protein
MIKYFGKLKIWLLIGCVFVLIVVSGLLLAVSWKIEGEHLNLNDRLTDAELNKTVRKSAGEVLRFGFDLRASAREDAQQYLPFLRYLERETSLRFELRFTPKDGDIVEDLGRGVIQLAAVGAGSYILCRFRYGAIPLVRGLNSEGRDEYQSVIIVAPDSPIRGINAHETHLSSHFGQRSTQGTG